MADVKEFANIVYDTLVNNTQHEQIELEQIQACWVEADNEGGAITIAFNGKVYDIVITDSSLKVCNWCGETFQPDTSDHETVCSNTCFHEEHSCQ